MLHRELGTVRCCDVYEIRQRLGTLCKLVPGVVEAQDCKLTMAFVEMFDLLDGEVQWAEGCVEHV